MLKTVGVFNFLHTNDNMSQNLYTSKMAIFCFISIYYNHMKEYKLTINDILSQITLIEKVNHAKNHRHLGALTIW